MTYLGYCLTAIMSLGIASIAPSPSRAEVQYLGPIDAVIRGTWIAEADEPIQTFGDQAGLDLNGDAQVDIQFDHGYEYAVYR